MWRARPVVIERKGNALGLVGDSSARHFPASPARNPDVGTRLQTLCSCDDVLTLSNLYRMVDDRLLHKYPFDCIDLPD